MTPVLRTLVAVVCLLQSSSCSSLVFRPQAADSGWAEGCPHQCQCNVTYREVFCENHGRDLPYIPKFPPWTEEIVFTGNYLPSLTQETFANVSMSQTTRLYLEVNSIQNISGDAFENFSRLAILRLAKNNVSHPCFKKALAGIGRLPSLRMLDLGKMHLSSLDEDVWDGLNSSRLETLWVYHNTIHKFNLSRLSGMRHLKELHLDGNLISSFVTKRGVASNLEILRLSYNDMHFIPDMCTDGKPIYPKLRSLDLSYNSIWFVKPYQINCSKSIEFLDLSGNLMQHFETDFLTGMEALTMVKFNYLRLEGNVPRYFISLGNPPNIRYISMINSGIRIGHDNFSADFFAGCGSLSELYLGQNFFSLASEDFLHSLLSPLKNLTLLDLSSCELHWIPDAVSSLTNLREIWLFNNYIISWSGQIFLGLNFLRNISLDVNQITTVDDSSFPAPLLENLAALNLSMNPFSCTCDLLWFIRWMRTNRSLFTGNLHNYACASPLDKQHLTLLQLTFTETTCLLSHEASSMIVGIIVVAILFIIACPLIFRYRWHLQSAVFMLRYRSMREEVRRVQRQFQYDAFLIYSDTDSPHVWREFVPRLERDRGLHLCVHERDFLPGKWIMDNIVDCMLASRCVVVLLSNALATSEWCQFELNLAHAEVMEGETAPLVLLLLEDIALHNMTPTLYAVLKTITYLRYPALSQDMDEFWVHVHRALTES